MPTLTRFDMAEYLDSEELIIEYLNQSFEDEDPKAFLKALGTVARARGMSDLARKTGIPRESLYHALSEKGNPSWSTLRKITDALGVSLSLRPASAV